MHTESLKQVLGGYTRIHNSLIYSCGTCTHREKKWSEPPCVSCKGDTNSPDWKRATVEDMQTWPDAVIPKGGRLAFLVFINQIPERNDGE